MTEQKLVFSLFSTTLIFLWCLQYQDSLPIYNNVHKRILKRTSIAKRKQPLQEPKTTTQKRVMHTFYDRLSETKSTGMTNKDDRVLLETWSAAWRAAGWEPKILVLDDAQKHPDYEKYKDSLKENTDGVYNQMCYIRWLAMAANGGGWMCDYDVFPIPLSSKYLQPHHDHDHDLPHDGKLTVYEFTREGGVPSLISGTAEEWDRMAHAVIEKSFDKSIHSDMFAIMNIHQTDPEAFILANKVLKGHVAMKEVKITTSLCMMWFGYGAIHFSHFSIGVGKDSGRLGPDANPSSRSQIASDWMEEWIQVCRSDKRRP